jgi:hypothetical protein
MQLVLLSCCAGLVQLVLLSCCAAGVGAEAGGAATAAAVLMRLNGEAANWGEFLL